MMQDKQVLVSGGSGFIGSALLEVLPASTCAIGRTKPKQACIFHKCDLLNDSLDLLEVLQGVDVVVHCAARAHVMHEQAFNPLDEYRRINTDATLRLARSAAAAKVKRFIFISSIKVNGESTSDIGAFSAVDPHGYKDYYGQSKSEAEKALLQLAKETNLEVVIIRPTLVYGPGVKANFASLLSLVNKGIPLPFSCISDNKRSVVSLTNLVDLIITCIDHPKAANQVFLVSDDNDISTSVMVRQMAIALGKPTTQIPIPIWLYKLLGKLFNKSDVIGRLTGSLQVDISHTKDTLGWTPPQTLQDGFKQTAEAFLQSQK